MQNSQILNKLPNNIFKTKIKLNKLQEFITRNSNVT